MQWELENDKIRELKSRSIKHAQHASIYELFSPYLRYNFHISSVPMTKDHHQNWKVFISRKGSFVDCVNLKISFLTTTSPLLPCHHLPASRCLKFSDFLPKPWRNLRTSLKLKKKLSIISRRILTLCFFFEKIIVILLKKTVLLSSGTLKKEKKNYH